MFLLTSLLGYLLSLILLILVFPLVLIQSIVGNQRIFDPLVKGACRLVPLTFGIRVKRSGREHLRDLGPCVFISNHVNLLDPILVYGFIPRFIRGLELDDHFSWPLWGPVITRLGMIPISHKDTKSALQSLKHAAEVLKGGTSIIVFPEGHRTRDGLMRPFGGGPFRVAREAGVPICPIALKGLWERKSVHSFSIKPGRVDFVFGEAFTPEEIASLSDRELREQSRERIRQMLEE